MTDFNQEETNPVSNPASQGSDSLAQETDSVSRDTNLVSRDVDLVPRGVDSIAREASPVSREANFVAQSADSAAQEAESAAQDTDFASWEASAALREIASAQPQPLAQLPQEQPQSQSLREVSPLEQPQLPQSLQEQAPREASPLPQLSQEQPQAQPSQEQSQSPQSLQGQEQPQSPQSQSYYPPPQQPQPQPQPPPQQPQPQPQPQSQLQSPQQAPYQSPSPYQPQTHQHYQQPGFSAPSQQGSAPYSASTRHYQGSAPYNAPTQQQPTPQQYPAYRATTPPASNYQPASTASTRSQKAQSSSKVLAFVMGFVGILVGAALMFGVLFFTTKGFVPSTATNPSVITTSSNGDLTITPRGEDVSLAEVVAAKTLPSVVNIDVYATSGGGFYDDYDSSRGGSGLEEYGLGSGVVISEDGYILTNYHVVEGGSEFLVRFDQENQFKASVVGQDPTSDLAVLKVDAKGLTPVEIGDSGEVVVGEWVMALGSPFGLEKSVSTGIVSALFRSTTMESTTGVNFYANMIQTDAAINPGNSGGALVNAEGKLIGINTLISSSSGTSSGVGFAIPSNYAMNVAQQIMDGKEVEHAFLGVQLRSVDPGNASSFNSNVEAGAYVGEVVAGSPADTAGLKEGDIITKMDDTLISSAAELVINVRGHFVGDTVVLEIQRAGKAETINVTLGSDKS